jgi:hypothetical protein
VLGTLAQRLRGKGGRRGPAHPRRPRGGGYRAVAWARAALSATSCSVCHCSHESVAGVIVSVIVETGIPAAFASST